MLNSIQLDSLSVVSINNDSHAASKLAARHAEGLHFSVFTKVAPVTILAFIDFNRVLQCACP